MAITKIRKLINNLKSEDKPDIKALMVTLVNRSSFGGLLDLVQSEIQETDDGEDLSTLYAIESEIDLLLMTNPELDEYGDESDDKVE